MRLAYTGADGYLFIVNAAPKENLDRELRMTVFDEDGMPARDKDGNLVTRLLTDEEYRAFVLQHTIGGLPPGAVELVTLPDDWSPPDINHLYRDAWRKDGSVISVDMPLAREIHRGVMRNRRKPLLEALDINYLRALERNAPVAAILSQKQTLRDVTSDPAIEAAKTVGELRAVWPDCLKEVV